MHGTHAAVRSGPVNHSVVVSGVSSQGESGTAHFGFLRPGSGDFPLVAVAPQFLSVHEQQRVRGLRGVSAPRARAKLVRLRRAPSASRERSAGLTHFRTIPVSPRSLIAPRFRTGCTRHHHFHFSRVWRAARARSQLLNSRLRSRARGTDK